MTNMATRPTSSRDEHHNYVRDVVWMLMVIVQMIETIVMLGVM